MGFGGHYVLDKGFVATEAIAKFRFVKGDAAAGDRHIDIADTQGEKILGVCQEEITAGDATNGRVADVRLMGVSLVEAGAAVTQYDEVMTSAAGKAIAATATNAIVGVALDAAGADGDLIAVFLTGPAQPIHA